MGLSPSTLFHLTSKSGLKGILKDNFKIKYCFEKLSHNEKNLEMAIPMVSFCDIKISEITEHIGKYGSYGIGLSKEWASEKGLNPLLYLTDESDFSNVLISSIRKFAQIKTENVEDRYNLTNIFRYIKVYESDLTRKGKTLKNYRFADEREWRYTPKMRANKKFKDWLLPNEYDTPEKKRIENTKLANERLYFNANQILYIIVKKESEINEIINYIKTVKGKNYTMEEVDRLTTRILSCERILNDF
ncbi:abortive infection system antitoxin AbiGi family protein [Seonamhaeicola marinus]|uniref:Uncharacterized protein n=1 Tax=Seonamhaeicola marinus TaxID=1912246 RepID=A0A5D0I7M5_9FLAO|nr:abortive infection system antitoxin AbiGi family protein [Seonamhaeicola marinus]TYA78397.1 hypothetical protein FUA24_08550 [Seonamhaeicola marinus]